MFTVKTKRICAKMKSYRFESGDYETKGLRQWGSWALHLGNGCFPIKYFWRIKSGVV